MAAVSAVSPDAGPVDTRPPEDDIDGDDDDVSSVTCNITELTRFQLKYIYSACTTYPVHVPPFSGVHSVSSSCLTQVFFFL